MSNETSSLDTTLESPSKPPQEKYQSQKKPIFLVNYTNSINEKSDNVYKEEFPKKRIKKLYRRGRKSKNIHKINTNNTLDFDSILNTFFANKKEEVILPLNKNNITFKKHKKKIDRI